MSSDLTSLLVRACRKRDDILLNTNAVRLVNGQGDGIPGIAIDRYDQHYVVHAYEGAHTSQVSAVVDFVKKTFSPEYLVIKERSVRKTHVQDRVLIAKSGPRTIVQERGVRFEVDLHDTANVGLFLDMRENRWMVARSTEAKRVLNLFSYTCSFGVVSRWSNAAAVVNVDVSGKALERGKRNYELNGILPDTYEFVKADSLRYLTGAQKRNNHFDVIIIDPPTFSRHAGGIFKVEREVPGLIAAAYTILRSPGKMFISTNASTIMQGELEEITRTLASDAGRTVKKSASCGQDSDFPGSGTMKESHLAAVWVEVE